MNRTNRRTITRTLAARTLAAFLALLVVPFLASPVDAATDLPAPTNTGPLTGGPLTGPGGPPELTGVRTGRHDGYDRTVFDFTGGTPGYVVEYGPLVGIGTGDPIPLAGAASLRIVFDGAIAYDLDTGTPSIDLSRVYNPNLPTLRQIRSGGAFEGRILFGLGLADRVGFRVLRLADPSRIAVDVAHQPTQPFTTETFWGGAGTAERVLINEVRTGAHPGYERVVIELATPATPLISVAYTLPDPKVIHIGLTAATIRPGALLTCRANTTVGLPQLNRYRVVFYDNGTASVFLTTNYRTGYRVLLLSDPTRLVVDIAT